MSERVQRELRKHAHEVAKNVMTATSAASLVARAAVENEQITRQRVLALETGLKMLLNYAEKTEHLAQDLANWRARPFLGRMLWLCLGR